MIKLYNIALLVFATSALSLFACDGPALPPVDVDAAITLPEPIALEAFAPDVLDAVALVHPSTCPAPRVRELTHEAFRYATGACGSGACNADCAACLTSQTVDDVITIVPTENDETLAAFVLHYYVDCEGGVWSPGEWTALRQVLAR